MPIYEYSCLECGHEFEKLQKVSDSPVRKCPSCSRLKARRMISRTSFVLKGDGWYVTDYPSKDRKAAMKSESGTGSNGDAAKPSEKTTAVKSVESDTKSPTKTTKAKTESKTS